MCLIIHNPLGEPIPEEWIRNARENNPHGFGIMWPENERVNTIRGMMDVDSILSIISGLQGKQYACHFRYRTHGETNVKQCHPHKLINDKLYMMHNGILGAFPAHPTQSDTALFAKSLRKEIYSGKFDYNLFFSDEVIESFNASVGSNKLLFMDETGRTAIVNEKLGAWKNGVWLSNISSTMKQSKYYHLYDDEWEYYAYPTLATCAFSGCKNKPFFHFDKFCKEHINEEKNNSASVSVVKYAEKANSDWTKADDEYLAEWMKMRDIRDRRRSKIVYNRRLNRGNA